jgi:hypothetical protein
LIEAMRRYPTNSPQAAARIVALALVADGHASKTEFDMLERLGAYKQLGLEPAEMQRVLQEFCEDLLQARHSQWGDAGQIDTWLLGRLMAEIDDPGLRRVVLGLCVAVVESDNHVADGESIVLVSAIEQWGLHHHMLGEPSPP